MRDFDTASAANIGESDPQELGGLIRLIAELLAEEKLNEINRTT